MENVSEAKNGTAKKKSEEGKPTRSQWQLMLRQFKRHRLAMIGLFVLLIFYAVAIAPNFFAPYDPTHQFPEDQVRVPPQTIRFIDQKGNFHFRPFVYKRVKEFNMETYEEELIVDTSKRYPLRFFVQGNEYSLFGLFKTDRHLFGVGEGCSLHLFGTNAIGQDLFSRTLVASRISLSIGLVGVIISSILGVIIGGISGYYGGVPDLLIQRVIEMLMGIPRIPLWMALAAAIPQTWPLIKVYFFITIILSIVGWTGLARNVRSKLISLRNEDFIRAAQGVGASDWRIIIVHLVPNFFSYVIVHLTLAVPGMIIGETALSFLGIGLRAPVVSWGVLLQQAQTFTNVANYPWVMIPAIFVVIAVLSFNFVGDGMRDAADPFAIT